MSAAYVWDAKTDVGAVRPHNEDCFTVDSDRGLFVVCDGMGGHARGEVASSMACETIRNWVAAAAPSPRLDMTRALLVEAIEAANRRVFGLRGAPATKPGTTVAAILWMGDRVVVAHVGDSRAYRLRGDALDQLTRDHSLANQLVDEEKITPEEAKTFALRNVITRAVGTHRDVEVDIHVSRVSPGDVFLLASDGLEVLPSDEIRACLALEPAAATGAMIARALRAGAPDNVTVVVVRAGGAG